MNNARITELESLINKYATSYYSGESEVSDEYFDSLVDELRRENPNSEVLTTGWGFKVDSSKKKKVPHRYGLYIGSLSKIKDVKDIPESFLQNDPVRVSAKLDGLSVVSYYVDGIRVQCVTRGDGYEGMDITDKMDLIFPEGKELPGKITCAIRGEVVMPMTIWNNKVKYQKLREENPSANPRNIASGYLNRDNLTKDDAEDLRYVVYKMLYAEDYYDGASLKIILSDFKNLGFDVVPECYNVNLQDENSLKELFDKWNILYPCDGLVFTMMKESFKYNEVAYKFQAESVEVIVKDITYNATRTGRMAPLIHFDAVSLSGAMVQKCSGFNAAFIRDNKIGPGAKIEVCRSGEVIPHIMNVIEPCEEGYLPEVCPHCGNKLVWKNTDLVCNAENESQMPYTALTVLAPLDGAGDAIYSNIVKAMDLYSLDSFKDFIQNIQFNDLDETLNYIFENSDLSGDVTFNKVKTILGKLLDDIDLRDALVACSIPGVSEKMSEKIVFNYPEILEDACSGNINKNKLYSIDGIGDSIVNSLITFENRIAFMSNFKIVIPEKEEIPEVQFKVAITGKLSVKRSVFEEELKQHGFQLSDIKKDTKYLITDNPNSSSSKNKLADEWGITKITEQDFRNKFINN